MDDEEYLELAGLIRDEIVELGLYDIADFSHYADARRRRSGAAGWPVADLGDAHGVRPVSRVERRGNGLGIAGTHWREYR